jgi:hypothetical protein
LARQKWDAFDSDTNIDDLVMFYALCAILRSIETATAKETEFPDGLPSYDIEANKVFVGVRALIPLEGPSLSSSPHRSYRAHDDIQNLPIRNDILRLILPIDEDMNPWQLSRSSILTRLSGVRGDHCALDVRSK